ncbi:MAG: hypothetical protein JEZ03_08150 [Bacteroidales bacterium]|nr:hypothetical protein [Bacteroidales bacterium]
MESWRTTLNKYFSEQEISKTKKSIQTIKENVIIPALNELKVELNKFDYVHAEMESEPYFEGYIGGRESLKITQFNKSLFRCEIFFIPSVKSAFQMIIRYSYGNEIIEDDTVFQYEDKDLNLFNTEQIIELLVKKYVSISM